MLNAIPVVGWVLSFIFSVSLAVPFWLIWTVGGVGTLFDFLPDQFIAPGFWLTVGIFICASILRAVFIGDSFSSSSKQNDS